MIQAPDIGKMILEHTADSHVIEWPFGLGETHLPHGWMIGGTDFAPTKHVVFMALAAFLVFITVWVGGRQVARRHATGKGPRGFGAGVEAHAADYRPGMRTLLVERADGVVTVTMNRPEKKNAVNTEMTEELISVFRSVADSDDDAALPEDDDGTAPADEEKKAPPQQDEQLHKAIQVLKTKTS